jgi:hypothetical protein
MTGPVIIGGGLLLIFLAGFRYLAGKPLPEKEWTPFEKANFIAGKIGLIAGAVCLVAGVLWTIKEMLS